MDSVKTKRGPVNVAEMTLRDWLRIVEAFDSPDWAGKPIMLAVLSQRLDSIELPGDVDCAAALPRADAVRVWEAYTGENPDFFAPFLAPSQETSASDAEPPAAT